MTQSCVQRITDYLSGGGLFNPEMATHNRVRDLLIDCRDELRRAEQAERDRDKAQRSLLAEETEHDETRKECDTLQAYIDCANKAMDAAENAGGDAAHRAVNLAYRIKVQSGELARVKAERATLAEAVRGVVGSGPGCVSRWRELYAEALRVAGKVRE